MKPVTTLITVTLFLITTAYMLGAQAADSEAPTERSPGDMTVDERREMMGVAAGYDNCVYSEAMANVGAYQDIREVADFAMGKCQTKLDELQELITGYGMPGGYAESFAHRIRSRAARKLLPELAIRKAGG